MPHVHTVDANVDARDQGKTWDTTNASRFNPGWLLYTPTSMLGKSTSDLVVAKECTNASDGDACNADFGLLRCNGTAPCAPSLAGGAVPPCEAQNSTIGRRTGVAERLCVGHSHKLVEEVYNTIVEAESYLDFSSLSAPDGRFLAAVRNAFSVLHGKRRRIHIRMVFGFASAEPNFFFFSLLSRPMPTANAEDACRSEGT